MILRLNQHRQGQGEQPRFRRSETTGLPRATVQHPVNTGTRMPVGTRTTVSPDAQKAAATL